MHRWVLTILILATISMVVAATRQVWQLTQESVIPPTTPKTVPVPPNALPSTITITQHPTTTLTITPAATITVLPTVIPNPTPFPVPQSYIAYRVKAGDTLASIAQA
ncbi:MAG: hypothetical protein EBS29_14625, partial [Chloroflexia bacterium]|nr:hypothetical protein [Chloroflexia bacterium]